MTDKQSAVLTSQLQVSCIQPGLPDEMNLTVLVS